MIDDDRRYLGDSELPRINDALISARQLALQLRPTALQPLLNECRGLFRVSRQMR